MDKAEAIKEDVFNSLYEYLYNGYCDRKRVKAFVEFWIATKWDGESTWGEIDAKRTIFWDWNEWNGWVL